MPMKMKVMCARASWLLFRDIPFKTPQTSNSYDWKISLAWNQNGSQVLYLASVSLGLHPMYVHQDKSQACIWPPSIFFSIYMERKSKMWSNESHGAMPQVPSLDVKRSEPSVCNGMVRICWRSDPQDEAAVQLPSVSVCHWNDKKSP